MRMPLIAATAVALLAATAHGQTPKSEEDKMFYALGVEMAKGLAPFDLSKGELEMVKKGLTDAIAGKADAELAKYAEKLPMLAQSRQGRIGEKNRERAEKVMADAAKEKGAVKTDSGLVVVPVREGKGTAPTAESTVKVHYKGTLPDGKQFDSSYDRGEPATFPLGRVVPCWREGLQHIKPGGKAVLYCPPELAYGDRAPPEIGPGQALRFEVELLEVQ